MPTREKALMHFFKNARRVIADMSASDNSLLCNAIKAVRAMAWDAPATSTTFFHWPQRDNAMSSEALTTPTWTIQF